MDKKAPDKKSLIETEREFQKGSNNPEAKNSNGRIPDQQHHMKDQENLRK
jgi:hypothetical protein